MPSASVGAAAVSLCTASAGAPLAPGLLRPGAPPRRAAFVSAARFGALPPLRDGRGASAHPQRRQPGLLSGRCVARRRAVPVAARYEALLEPALDESLRRALVSAGSAAAAGGGGAAAAAGAAAQHALAGLHHAAPHAGVAAAAGGAQGGLFLSTFCALSVALGALLYHFGGVVSELMALQKRSSVLPEVCAAGRGLALCWADRGLGARSWKWLCSTTRAVC
jgi:hypothetical protein